MAKKTFAQAFVSGLNKEQRKGRRDSLDQEKRRKAVAARSARDSVTEKNRKARQRDAKNKKKEKYLAWAKLLCLKHDIPEECAEFIARESMKLQANKSEMESVIIAKRDWKSFDWKTARASQKLANEMTAAYSRQLRTALSGNSQSQTKANLPKKRFPRPIRWVGYLVAWFLALIGIVGISEGDWIIGGIMVVPALTLAISYFAKQEERAEKRREQKAIEKMQKKLNASPNPIWKIIKWVLVLAALWVVWYIGGYYIWVAILGG